MTTNDPDDALLGDLRRVLEEIDPIPEHVRIAASAAIEWRTLDAELVALVGDSAVDEPVVALRGGAALTPRALTFQAADLVIEIEAEPTEHGLRLAGQIVPPQAAQVAVRHGDDELAVTSADTRGRFAVSGIHAGPVSVRCRLDDGAGARRIVETAWLEL